MASYIGLILSFLAGLMVGGGLVFAIRPRSKPEVAEPVETQAKESPSWWLRRKNLTASQLQILQFIETEGADVTLQTLQKRWAKVPDRELHYRMEQIHLLGFLEKEKVGHDVTFRLTPAYAEALEALQRDKTVMLPPSS